MNIKDICPKKNNFQATRTKLDIVNIHEFNILDSNAFLVVFLNVYSIMLYLFKTS